MKVEWIGGPDDGQVLDLKDSTTHVNIAVDPNIIIVPVCYNPLYKIKYHLHYPYHLINSPKGDANGAE